MHAVRVGFIVEFHRRPQLRAILWRDEVMNRAVLDRFAEIPLPAHRNLAFPVAVKVPGGDTDVVLLCETVRDDVFFPGRVLIPLDGRLVGEHDVFATIAVDIDDLQTVADFDFIDLHFAPLELRRSGREGK